MSQPFEKMAEEGVPKTAEPAKVAAPKMEQQDLPKLSAQDFRVYNRMSEHMDMFVSPDQARSAATFTDRSLA
jgi:hypothetical protein